MSVWYYVRMKSIRRSILSVVLVGVLGVVCINAFVYSQSKKYILNSIPAAATAAQYDFADRAPEDIPVALVLGASVYRDGRLSPMLEERAKTGLELYRAGLVQKILVSGDNMKASYNEVIPIRKYLLAQGVPEEDVFTDFAGFNTYDSMYRAHEIFGVKNVFVVTQRFHLSRAIYTARQLGLNAFGVPAGAVGTVDTHSANTDAANAGAMDTTGPGKAAETARDTKAAGTFNSNTFREIAATVKTFFEVHLHAEPKLLGPHIPITGDGRKSLE